MFARTLSSLGQAVGWSKKSPETSEAVETDRRVWVRYPCDVEASFQPANLPDSQRLSAQVRNISRGGINLMLSCPVEIGAFLSVELPTASARATSTVLAYVARVTPATEGEWSIGCSFASELSDSDLEPFGARKLKSEAQDERTWVRFPCQARATYQPVKTPETPAAPAEVLNISAGGAALLVTAPVELGTLLNLELLDESGQFRLCLLACVVRLSGQGGLDWVLGCNLIRELSHRELTALLQHRS
jgi:hypothetical protein